MPISFLEALARVSPDKPVTPGSKEHDDILTLMRQSGHVFAAENVPEVLPPPKHIYELSPYRERPTATVVSKPVSKREWLSVEANRKEYDDHIAANRIAEPPGVPPAHLSWHGKVPTKTGPMSKREWVASLK
jgi:hypothetical protein